MCLTEERLKEMEERLSQRFSHQEPSPKTLLLINQMQEAFDRHAAEHDLMQQNISTIKTKVEEMQPIFKNLNDTINGGRVVGALWSAFIKLLMSIGLVYGAAQAFKNWTQH